MRVGLAILVGAALLSAAGCQCWHKGDGASMMDKDIMAVARSRPELSTFVTAVDAAGLAVTLSQEGPYTVFAPTNDAFDRLPPGNLDRLLNPENRTELAEMLKYHVINGRVTEEEAIRMRTDTALSGEMLNFEGTVQYAEWPAGVEAPSGSTVLRIDRQANVVRGNIRCSNGIIQEIDAVLIPQ
jgi:uncharacterized surface protein with fasciclin (FAS1) repeats